MDNAVKEKAKTGFWASFLAGASSAALGKTAVAPLDKAKIVFQASSMRYSTRNAFQFLKSNIQESGMASLWRGNSATLARIIPYAGILFSSHEKFKALLDVDQKHEEDSKPLKRLLAGSMAGFTAHSVTYPLDVARAVMTIASHEVNTNLKQSIMNLIKEQGPKALFSGYTASCIGVIPYSGINFGTYGLLKKKYSEYKREELNTLELGACGALSGAAAQIVTYPMEVVRRKHQAASLRGEEKKSILEVIKTIQRDEGPLRGLYKGLSMNWIRGPIQAGIIFSGYEYGKKFFDAMFS